jgi:predicted porin
MFNLGEFSMKKTLVAVAALAAVSAFAQSSVTLYGRVDAGLFSSKSISTGGGTANPVRLSQTGIGNGNDVGLTTSRWGMRGTEDLGGGLKANFKVEGRLNVDDGTQNGSRLFNGETLVGFSGGFGTLKVGRVDTSFDDLRGIAVSKNTFDSAWTPVGDSYGVGVGGYTGRLNNSIKYDSANFGGVSGSLQYGFGENKSATLSAGSVISAHIKYANGPLVVGYGFQSEKAQVANNFATVTATNPVGRVVTTGHNAISAAYDLGVVALSGGINTSKLNARNQKDTDYSLGVTMPLGAATISAGFASSKTKTAGAKAGKGSGFALAATYALSKRTQLYTGLKSTNNKDAANFKTLDNDLFSLGVRHDF